MKKGFCLCVIFLTLTGCTSFNLFDSDLDWNESYITTELWILDINTGIKKNIYFSNNADFGMGNIQISSDNRYVMFEQNFSYHYCYDLIDEKLITVNIDTNEYVWLNTKHNYLCNNGLNLDICDIQTGQSTTLYSSIKWISDIKLSPDLSKIVFNNYGGVFNGITDNHTIVVDTNQGQILLDMNEQTHVASFHQWSPDSNYLIIRVRYKDITKQDIIVMDIASGIEIYRERFHYNAVALWNGDGSKIYIMVPDFNKNQWTVNEMNPDGTDFVEIYVFNHSYKNMNEVVYVPGINSLYINDYIFDLTQKSVYKFRYKNYSCSIDLQMIANWDDTHELLYIENFDGSNKRLITAFENKGIRGVKWSLDKTQLFIIVGEIK